MDPMEPIFQRRSVMYDRGMDLDKLAQLIVKLAVYPSDGTPATYNSDVKEALRLLYEFETSASLGKAVAKNAEIDKQTFLTLKNSLQSEIESTKVQIVDLQKALAEERVQAGRRQQYNVLGREIEKFATVEKSSAEKQKVNDDIARLELEKRKIDDRKHKARCEFRLLLQTVDELDALTKEQSASEAEDNEGKSGAANNVQVSAVDDKGTNAKETLMNDAKTEEPGVAAKDVEMKV